MAVRTSYLCIVLCLGAVLSPTLEVGTAQADLINPLTIFNTLDHFEAIVFNTTVADVMPVGIVLGGMGGAWSASVDQNTFDGGVAFNDIRVRVFHNIGPHPGEGLNLAADFTFLNVVPGGPIHTFTGTMIHPPLGHLDNVIGTYLPAVGGSQLSVGADHVVPEPSTLLLLGSSLAGLGGFAWRRQRRK
jgi:PEP-CTERM motif-containing protein